MQEVEKQKKVLKLMEKQANTKKEQEQREMMIVEGKKKLKEMQKEVAMQGGKEEKMEMAMELEEDETGNIPGEAPLEEALLRASIDLEISTKSRRVR